MTGETSPGQGDARCPSGVEGLDDILGGGLPAAHLYLVQGDPGSGKTTLALQFLLEGRRRGERGLYITLSESRQELMTVARSHGWAVDELPMLEMSAIEGLLGAEAQTTVFHPSEVELNGVSRLILDEAQRVRPTRLVFDSLSEFRLLAETALRYRRQLLNFKRLFAQMNCTVLLLDDKNYDASTTDPHVMSIAHGVIELQQLAPEYGAARRRMRVMKLRGTRFREGYHDYAILRGGVQVFPRLVAAEHHTGFSAEIVASGVPELDALLGGGLQRGTTTLLLGPAGSGKSTLALHYAWRAAAQGEKALMFSFDETVSVMRSRARGLGMDLDGLLGDGRLVVQQVDPAELTPGEFAVRVRRGVEAGARAVVIDSLNGYLNAMPGERYLNNQLHELSSYLNQQGVLTLLVVAQHGLVTQVESPFDLSYLADTVVHLRYFEAAGEVRQAVAVIKKRIGEHERSIRELRMQPGRGIRVGAPLTAFHGVLSGLPVFEGPREQVMGQ